MNDKISGSVDYYVKETSDLLATVPVVAGTNFTNFILTNVGSMKNEGVEVNLNLGLLNTSTTKVDLGLNASYNKNTVTGLSLVEDTSSVGIQVGEFLEVLEILPKYTRSDIPPLLFSCMRQIMTMMGIL